MLARFAANDDAREAALSVTPAVTMYEAQTLLSQTNAAYVLMARFGSPST